MPETKKFKVLNRGPYPDSLPEQMPGWYLTHLVGSVGEIAWESLDADQQAAIKAEIEKRDQGKGVPEAVKSPVEAGPPAATSTTAPASVPATTEPEPLTGKGSRKAKAAAEGTVDEAHDIIAAAALDELDVIEKAEAAGKNRVGVHAAIEKRRNELTAPPTP